MAVEWLTRKELQAWLEKQGAKFSEWTIDKKFANRYNLKTKGKSTRDFFYEKPVDKKLENIKSKSKTTSSVEYKYPDEFIEYEGKKFKPLKVIVKGPLKPGGNTPPEQVGKYSINRPWSKTKDGKKIRGSETIYLKDKPAVDEWVKERTIRYRTGDYIPFKGKSKWETKELNKAAQYYEGKDWKDLKTMDERKLVASNLSRNKGEFVIPERVLKLAPDEQIEFKEKFPEFADADFDNHKWGYDINGSPEEVSKGQRVRYIQEDLGWKETAREMLPEAQQEKIKRIFGDEWGKEWNFKKYTYGIPGAAGENKNLAKRMRSVVKPERSGTIPDIGFSSPKDENYLLKQFLEASKENPNEYSLLRNQLGKVKGVNVRGQNYYHADYPQELMKAGDLRITDHPSHEKVQNYLKVAKKAHGNPSEFLNELFIKHGYKVPTITQLLRHFYNKEGITTTRNVIEKHHPGRVENIPEHLQLLGEWGNTDARRIHGLVDKKRLSPADAHKELKTKGIQIILDDGTKLGAPDIAPEKQFQDYVKYTERKVKQVVKAGELPQLAEKMNLIPLVNKLVADGAAGGPSCDLPVIKAVRTGNAPGGVIGPDCSAQIKQVLQENPDQLIKEAAEAKVKPGESTGFRNVARQILNKIPKGGRLGAILAGAGAVGAGTWAMMGGAEADTMKYNATTGQFDDAEGEPETQEGILNWIADNPIKSGLAPIPALLGASHFAPKAVKGALTSFPALVAPALAAEKLYQYKEGVDPISMATDPLNVIFAAGWETKASAAAKEAFYKDPKNQRLFQMKNFKNPRNIPNALRSAVMSPRAAGTKALFGLGKGPLAPSGLARLGGMALRATPIGWGITALSAANYGWNKYKDVRDTNSILDSMRERGSITEKMQIL